MTYDALRRDGTRTSLALRFHGDGRAETGEALTETHLPRTVWRLPRPVRADAGSRPRLTRRLEDAPFYARSAIESRLWGEAATGIHESLDLDRFATPWCKLMLPFRMPRRA